MPKIILASGPVIVEDGKVLLDKQGDDEFWKFCGGKVREGEILVETCIRRAKEELGIDIEVLDPTPFISYTSKETADGKADVILVHFLAKRIGGIRMGEGVNAWGLFDLGKLRDMDLAPNIIPALKQFGFVP